MNITLILSNFIEIHPILASATTVVLHSTVSMLTLYATYRITTEDDHED